jgi:hypothetical protein
MPHLPICQLLNFHRIAKSTFQTNSVSLPFTQSFNNGSTALFWALDAFSVSSAWLLWWGISLSEGRYLHTEQRKHRINTRSHPCLDWNSNPRPQYESGRRQFMPQTARPLWSAPFPFPKQKSCNVRKRTFLFKICSSTQPVWIQMKSVISCMNGAEVILNR